jgi:formylglycine-generating enzyme required for sulfatase activity
MVWIPGGEFWMGAEEFPDAQPWHRVLVDGFWMDKTEVTNDQFAKFVKATRYVTRRTAGKSRGRVSGLCAAKPSGETERPLPMVELREGR